MTLPFGLLVAGGILAAAAAAAVEGDVESRVLQGMVVACPGAEIVTLGAPDVAALSLDDMAPGGPPIGEEGQPPCVIWSPDSAARVVLTFIDSPPQCFVRSSRHGIGSAVLHDFTGRDLLSAEWIDPDRFLTITSPRDSLFAELDGPLRATLDDFARHERTTWEPVFRGELPESSALADTVRRRESHDACGAEHP